VFQRLSIITQLTIEFNTQDITDLLFLPTNNWTSSPTKFGLQLLSVKPCSDCHCQDGDLNKNNNNNNFSCFRYLLTANNDVIWQWQPKLVQTVQQHRLVWITLDT